MEDTSKEDNMDSWGRSAGRGSPRSSQIYSRSHRSHVTRAHPQHHQNARGRKIISGRRSLVGHSRVDVDTASARPKGHHNRQAPAFGTIGSLDNRILLDRLMLQSRKKSLPSSKSLERALSKQAPSFSFLYCRVVLCAAIFSAEYSRPASTSRTLSEHPKFHYSQTACPRRMTLFQNETDSSKTLFTVSWISLIMYVYKCR